MVLGQAKGIAKGPRSEAWDILELPGWRLWALLTALPRSPVPPTVGTGSQGDICVVLPSSGSMVQVCDGSVGSLSFASIE